MMPQNLSRLGMSFQESENIELKKSTSELKEAVISLVAMLNKHQRAELWFGIRNDGAVVGQQMSEKTLRDISKTIADKVDPKVYPAIEQVMVDGKQCLLVRVEGEDYPYYAYGRAYIRVGDEDRQLSARELENLILQKNREKLRWDMEPCPKAEVDDISGIKLKAFLKGCGLKHDNIPNALEKLNLVKDGKLLNTAVLCFAKKPEKFFPNARLRCAVFGATDTTVTLDMKDFYGDVFTLIRQADEYIHEHINIGMRVEGLLRVDVPEINREAFREAIINAFCHRDYREYDSVNIAVFKDRVEIRSPGRLYGGLTVAMIRKKMVSIRRNELLADLFHRVHFIEKWGRGVRMILEREPETEFEDVGGELQVKSLSGHGATFYFSLPFKQALPQAAELAAAAPLSSRGKILVVDDSANEIELIGHLLKKDQVTFELCQESKRAMALLVKAYEEKAPFTLALLDIMMPELDGLELAGLIKSDPRFYPLRLVAYTARVDNLNDVNFPDFFSFVAAKPLSLETMKRILHEAVPTQESVECPASLAGDKVLVVDDNPLNRMLVGRILKKVGVGFSEAENGLSAIEMVRKEEPDLVLMDQKLPVMNGAEGIGRLRESYSKEMLPILAFTADDFEESQAAMLAAGADGIVNKPLNSDQLIEQLCSSLHGRSDKTTG
ncbi:MAG: response regulator [Deltaproteobacteria bacterium]|nr:response regulator [Deltaproteobacteria bacterium]